jgi:hypothetical protein
VFQIGQVKGALHRALKLMSGGDVFEGAAPFNGSIVPLEEDASETEGGYRSLAAINLLMHLV